MHPRTYLNQMVGFSSTHQAKCSPSENGEANQEGHQKREVAPAPVSPDALLKQYNFQFWCGAINPYINVIITTDELSSSIESQTCTCYESIPNIEIITSISKILQNLTCRHFRVKGTCHSHINTPSPHDKVLPMQVVRPSPQKAPNHISAHPS